MYDTTKPYKDAILKMLRATQETPFVSVRDGVVVEKRFNYPEYHHTDGIGTKGVYHWQARSFQNAVQDALAMNLNDLALMRAYPYALCDHLILPEDDHEAVHEIMKHLSEECSRRKIAVTGGETAIHTNTHGLELSMTMLGFIKEPKPNRFQAGDILIGMSSNGLHSNGFTAVREIFGNELRPEFTAPTYIYFDVLQALSEGFEIHGMAHVTGGAFFKLKNFLTDADTVVRRDHQLKPQQIFGELYEKGMSDEDMYKTFNCGIGFIIGVAKNQADDCLRSIQEFPAAIIGEIIPGNGRVRVQSSFSSRDIIY